MFNRSFAFSRNCALAIRSGVRVWKLVFRRDWQEQACWMRVPRQGAHASKKGGFSPLLSCCSDQERLEGSITEWGCWSPKACSRCDWFEFNRLRGVSSCLYDPWNAGGFKLEGATSRFITSRNYESEFLFVQFREIIDEGIGACMCHCEFANVP
mgnify:CR=1 FL=1